MMGMAIAESANKKLGYTKFILSKICKKNGFLRLFG